ncbi:Nucleoside-diphosphate-sugar epimerase [Cnuella takakiae]|uniref:Nucleoside-diphosphate-sugar epimerase n=1 Tax=Cnuella takakiae TaxID=1302690 RepID=A0A1M5DDH7_9BACT|nr:NAD-dependent epimerase/dehydratase family protein [Cnuella takakiae]OLY94002.1 NAD-dependent dehydratase [Cnuella takakiae]SHF65138.1 Nucleoside-diphosphate-sugar epimerase [Cnuella takakiae]
MQTILGAGGAIGTELAKALAAFTTDIRLVSRNPKKVNASDNLLSANLLDAAAVSKAVAGSDIVYLVAGLEYKARVWEAQWPVVMRNTIDACKQHGAKLVFFDIIYMYDPAYLGHLTEETPIRPVSRKGAVRAAIAQTLLDEIKAGKLQAMIVRAADFLGMKNSVLTDLVGRNFAKGKKANWIGNPDKRHSFTYTVDAGRATALLGNTPDAYGQVWHLPTDNTPLTGKQWMEAFAQTFQTQPRYNLTTRGMMTILGLFIPVLREVKEMAYQFEEDYGFDSSKFTNRFHIKATPYTESVQQVAAAIKAGK